MADVLKHLQRLREHETKQAQMELAKAERAEEAQVERVEENARTVRDARNTTSEDDAAEVMEDNSTVLEHVPGGSVEISLSPGGRGQENHVGWANGVVTPRSGRNIMNKLGVSPVYSK